MLDALRVAGLEEVGALGKLLAIQEQFESVVKIDTDVLPSKPLRRELRHARLSPHPKNLVR